MCFKSSRLTLAALCSLCVQPGRCSQRGSSMRAGAAATDRRSRPILRVSKTNEPVWRAAQAAEVTPSLPVSAKILPRGWTSHKELTVAVAQTQGVIGA